MRQATSLLYFNERAWDASVGAENAAVAQEVAK
jgi:hypothetical protein